MKSSLRNFLIVAGVCCAVASTLFGQARGRGAANAKTAAPVDLTGYWVAVVSEDWRHRIETPRKGDYESVAAESGRHRGSRRVGSRKRTMPQCCSARRSASGESCGQPTRLHITWQDDNTLKMDIDGGHANAPADFRSGKQQAGEKTWQGFSEQHCGRAGRGARRGASAAQLGNSTGPIAPGRRRQGTAWLVPALAGPIAAEVHSRC
jgi:hypothetical protein